MPLLHSDDKAVAEPLRQPHALAPRRRLHGPVPAPPRAVPRLRGRPAERDARVEDGHVRAVDARVARMEGEVERRREHRLRSRADAVATDEVDGEGGEAQERHVPQRDDAGRGAYDERALPYGARAAPGRRRAVAAATNSAGRRSAVMRIDLPGALTHGA